MPAFPIFQTTTATTAQNQFGINLLQQLVQADSQANIVVSPLGALAALALAMSAAGGITKAALGQLLFGAVPNMERAESAFADWLRQLLQLDTTAKAHEEQAGATLKLATRLWVDQHFAIAPAFIRQAKARYDAEAATLPLNSLAAVSTINEWVRRHTEGRIDSIVSAAALVRTPPPEIVLLNAVYFRARWSSEFDPNDTRPGLFRQADGSTQAATFMHQVSGSIGYLATETWQAVALPYVCFGRAFSMLVFLPNTPAGLPGLLAGLDATSWLSLCRAITSQGVEVELTFPRFRIEWSGDLVPALRQLGLEPALAPGADFSALGFRTKDGGGFIDSVLHKTFLEVDEQGTEAAAVTAIMWMGGSAYEPPMPRRVTVKVDSPFLYAIVDDQDGTLLFAGTLNKIPE
jgi:serpin B